MQVIKLRKANETGDEVGDLYINADQIVTVDAGASATEILTADGKTHWVKDAPADVAAAIKANS
jgi:hypothetical protein